MPIHAPKIEVLGWFDPLNGEQYQCNPQKAHPCVETRRTTYRLLKSVRWCDLCAWLRNKKTNTKNPNSGKLGIRPDYPRGSIEIRFCMVGGLWVAEQFFVSSLIKIG